MVKLLGLFLMFISAYCLEQGGLDLGLVQAFFIGLFMFLVKVSFPTFILCSARKCVPSIGDANE